MRPLTNPELLNSITLPFAWLVAIGCALWPPTVASSQVPLTSPLRATVQRTAGAYPLTSAIAFGRDSIVLAFADSSLTDRARRTGTWMFGPPTTKAEADGCPPEKVLGRRIARELWRTLGKPSTLKLVIVRIDGPWIEDSTGSQTKESSALYYPRFQLTGPWVGDSGNAPGAARRSRSPTDS